MVALFSMTLPLFNIKLKEVKLKFHNISILKGENTMKIKSPHPIYLEGSRKEAILLLHSFTGTVRDVKPLAKALNEENFTCFAPNYQDMAYL